MRSLDVHDGLRAHFVARLGEVLDFIANAEPRGRTTAAARRGAVWTVRDNTGVAWARGGEGTRVFCQGRADAVVLVRRLPLPLARHFPRRAVHVMGAGLHLALPGGGRRVSKPLHCAAEPRPFRRKPHLLVL